MLFDLFEEDEVEGPDNEEVDEVKRELKHIAQIEAHEDGLDKGELTKMFKRIAQIWTDQ